MSLPLSNLDIEIDEVINRGMSLLLIPFMLHAGILKKIIRATEEYLDKDPHHCIGAIFSLEEILQNEKNLSSTCSFLRLFECK
jgi:hypothetical protein